MDWRPTGSTSSRVGEIVSPVRRRPTTAVYTRRIRPMRQTYDDHIHTDSGHIIHDTKMALRHHKRYIPYVVVFIVVWAVYRFLVRSLGTPDYPCGHFVNKEVQNYSWTFPDCPPPTLVYPGGVRPVWGEECRFGTLEEAKYRTPAPRTQEAEGQTAEGQGKVKVPGLANACLPFPVEAFPRDGKEGRAQGEGHHTHKEGHHDERFEPRFVKLAPDGWLYGVFAVLDTRVGPFPEIRVFGVSRVVPGDIFCQISCQEHAHAVVSAPAKVTPLSLEEEGGDSCFWQEYAFSCTVRDSCTPGYVSLSRAPCGQVSGIIAVKRVQRSAPKHALGLCLSTIYDKRDSDIAYLTEYVESNRIFGVERIFLYGTHNVSRRYDAVLDVYRSQRYVETVPWAVPPEVDVVYRYGQVLQYAHCIYHNMEQVRYLALATLEDLLLPLHAPHWSTLFAHLSDLQRLDAVSHLTLEKQSLCLPYPGGEGDPESGSKGGRRPVHLQLVDQHTLGDVFRKPTYIVQPQGVIVPNVYSEIIAMRGWKSTKVNRAMAMVYHYGSNDTGCAKVIPRTRHEGRLCKHLPEIAKKVLYALEMFDLIHPGNKHHPLKPHDLNCN